MWSWYYLRAISLLSCYKTGGFCSVVEVSFLWLDWRGPVGSSVRSWTYSLTHLFISPWSCFMCFEVRCVQRKLMILVFAPDSSGWHTFYACTLYSVRGRVTKLLLLLQWIHSWYGLSYFLWLVLCLLHLIVQYYYNPTTQQYCYYDAQKQQYVPAP